ncbi:DUF6153 family protein [Naasia lichenicola]|uniref:Uncharacterized protein n=1 Tax=Naasia lichenicola TaxID=2565933 RepID=A0A4S4FLQ8_9MICO|nr:DUF6153 family protein [Naasia lichenicola]THG31024.1 hypothetical protein E6C64_10520 [Naasia lichenicola]
MSLSMLGGLVRRHRDTSPTLMLLAVVCAVVVGLLGMHTIATAAGNHGGGSMSMPMAVDTPRGHDAGMSPAAGSECTGTCDTGHSMAAMACVLALLLTALTLASAIALNVFGQGGSDSGTGGGNVAAPASALDNRAPPDLILLSISRT